MKPWSQEPKHSMQGALNQWIEHKAWLDLVDSWAVFLTLLLLVEYHMEKTKEKYGPVNPDRPHMILSYYKGKYTWCKAEKAKTPCRNRKKQKRLSDKMARSRSHVVSPFESAMRLLMSFVFGWSFSKSNSRVPLRQIRERFPISQLTAYPPC